MKPRSSSPHMDSECGNPHVRRLPILFYPIAAYISVLQGGDIYMVSSLIAMAKEALQKYPEQSFAQKFGLCNR